MEFLNLDRRHFFAVQQIYFRFNSILSTGSISTRVYREEDPALVLGASKVGPGFSPGQR